MNEDLLNRIAIAVECGIAASGKAPGWEYPIAEFPMKWEKLGISPHGPTEKPTSLEWMGHRFELYESDRALSYQRMVSENTSALLIRFYQGVENAPGTVTDSPSRP